MAKSSKHLHGKKNTLPPSKRFDYSMQDEDFEDLQRGFIPKETNVNTKKCMKLFRDWASAENGHSSSTIDRVPEDSLLTDNHGLHAHWLDKFCTEARWRSVSTQNHPALPNGPSALYQSTKEERYQLY